MTGSAGQPQASGRNRHANRTSVTTHRGLHGVWRAVGVAGVAAAVFGLAGDPAFGFFSLGGTGTGQAGTGTLQPLVIRAATLGSPSSQLTPGSSADLLLNVTNPNASDVTIIRVAQAGGVTVVGGSGCTSDPGWPGTLGNSGVSAATSTGLSILVAAGATQAVHVPNGAVITTSSAAGCQGASFQIPVTVAVQQG